MLLQLTIQNYALIEELHLDLSDGLTTLTGETGAGKSILLGALSLILGQRADLSVLRNTQQKCIIEGTFKIDEKWRPFFEKHHLDFDTHTILRREITPAGKSRAFVNDTPAKLSILQTLSEHLIDVHSQHQTLLLNDTGFQLGLLDAFAKNEQELQNYKEVYQQYKKLIAEKDRITHQAKNPAADREYTQFLFDELEKAKLQPGESDALQKELEELEHVGEIQEGLSLALHLLQNPEQGVQEQINEAHAAVERASRFKGDIVPFAERLNSVRIELDDLRMELENRHGEIEYNPERKTKLDERWSHLLHLQQKHKVDTEQELLQRQKELNEQLQSLDSLQQRQAKIDAEIAQATAKVQDAALQLRKSRKKVAPQLAQKVKELLSSLNMQDAEFRIDIAERDNYRSTGKDEVLFAFSANKGVDVKPLQKIASGGELSRVTLALKAIMARTKGLPSIIFDEIDSGVSGGTAGKIGDILSDMGQYMQVIAITHLPQIAARGQEHYKVEKATSQGQVQTGITRLMEEQRNYEIARLLSGENITDAALQNARELLSPS